MGKKNINLRFEIKGDHEKIARLQLVELNNYKNGEQRIVLTFDSDASKQDFLKTCSPELRQARSEEEARYPLQVILRGDQTKIRLFKLLFTAMSQFETIDKKSCSDLAFQFTTVDELVVLQRECGMDDVIDYLKEHPQRDNLLSYLADHHLACVATDRDASRLARECVDAHVSLIVEEFRNYPSERKNHQPFEKAVKKMWELDRKECALNCHLPDYRRDYFVIAHQIRQGSRQQAKQQLQVASARLFRTPMAAVQSSPHSRDEKYTLTS